MIRAMSLSLLAVSSMLLLIFLLAMVIQLQPGHGDPLCGRDCYPVQVQP